MRSGIGVARAVGSCVLTLASVLAAPPAALADDAAPEIHWSAPRECPSVKQLRAEIWSVFEQAGLPPKLFKVPVWGGPLTEVADGLNVTALTLDAANLYWVTVNGTVKKAPIEGGPTTTFDVGLASSNQGTLMRFARRGSAAPIAPTRRRLERPGPRTSRTLSVDRTGETGSGWAVRDRLAKGGLRRVHLVSCL